MLYGLYVVYLRIYVSNTIIIAALPRHHRHHRQPGASSWLHHHLTAIQPPPYIHTPPCPPLDHSMHPSIHMVLAPLQLAIPPLHHSHLPTPPREYLAIPSNPPRSGQGLTPTPLPALQPDRTDSTDIMARTFPI